MLRGRGGMSQGHCSGGPQESPYISNLLRCKCFLFLFCLFFSQRQCFCRRQKLRCKSSYKKGPAQHRCPSWVQRLPHAVQLSVRLPPPAITRAGSSHSKDSTLLWRGALVILPRPKSLQMREVWSALPWPPGSPHRAAGSLPFTAAGVRHRGHPKSDLSRGSTSILSPPLQYEPRAAPAQPAQGLAGTAGR